MKSVLITGGSRGIGKEMVRLFAKNGYSVAFTYLHSEKEANALSEETGATAYACDVSKSEDVSALFAKIGGVDVLINNAGISKICLFDAMSDTEWHQMMDTNLSGAFYTIKNALPYMLHQKEGCIINIASMWGEVGASCEVAYSTAKAGLIGLTKALSKEVGPSGIRVNSISPGVIDTDMNAHLSAQDKKELEEETPLQRIGTPQEVAQTALFLASDRASFITGQDISVSGGFVI